MGETEVQINSHLKIRPRCSNSPPSILSYHSWSNSPFEPVYTLPCVTLWANMFQMFITTITFSLPSSSFFINHAHLTLDMGGEALN